MSPDESAASWLFVEGADDLHSIVHLMEQHGVLFESKRPDTPYIKSSGGVNALLSNRGAVEAAVRLKRRVGFVVDADDAPVDRWEALRNQLADQGIELPPMPAVGGSIVRGSQADWKVGAWLMPDNQSPGKIEQFLETLVPANDVLLTHAGQSTTRAAELGALFSERDVPKARVHAWLAWQKDPG
jgi:hypothetical protein